MVEIDMVEFLPITAERLANLREITEQDESLQKLKHVIKAGWPDKREEVPPDFTLRRTYHSRCYSFQGESSGRPCSAYTSGGKESPCEPTQLVYTVDGCL